MNSGAFHTIQIDLHNQIEGRNNGIELFAGNYLCCWFFHHRIIYNSCTEAVYHL